VAYNPYNPYGPYTAYAPCPSQRIIVNNTGYILEVMQDNQRIAVLRNGEQCALRDNWLVPKTTVTVTGRTETGAYAGADSWIFNSASPEVWQINELRKPQPSR
jgi:hypothetical protein